MPRVLPSRIGPLLSKVPITFASLTHFSLVCRMDQFFCLLKEGIVNQKKKKINHLFNTVSIPHRRWLKFLTRGYPDNWNFSLFLYLSLGDCCQACNIHPRLLLGQEFYYTSPSWHHSSSQISISVKSFHEHIACWYNTSISFWRACFPCNKRYPSNPL